MVRFILTIGCVGLIKWMDNESINIRHLAQSNNWVREVDYWMPSTLSFGNPSRFRFLRNVEDKSPRES